MQYRIKVCTAIFFVTLLYTLSPITNNAYTGVILVMVTGCGTVGHYVFRDYIYSLPEIQMTITTKALLMFLYGLQAVYLRGALFMASCHFAESLVSKWILWHPVIICNILTFTRYFGELIAVAALIILQAAMSIRKFNPGIYYSCNNDLMWLVIVMVILAIVTVHFIVHLSVCGSLCQVNWFNALSKISLGIKPLPMTPNCYFPLVEVSGCIGILMFVAGSIIKFRHVLRNKKNKFTVKKQNGVANNLNIVASNDHRIEPTPELAEDTSVTKTLSASELELKPNSLISDQESSAP